MPPQQTQDDPQYSDLPPGAKVVAAPKPTPAQSFGTPQTWKPARTPQEHDQQQQEYANEIGRWFAGGMPDTRPMTPAAAVNPHQSAMHRVSTATGNLAMSPMTAVLAPKTLLQGVAAGANAGADELARGTSDSRFPLLHALTNIPNALSAASGGDPEAARQEMASGHPASAAAAEFAAPALGLGTSLIHPGAGGAIADTARELPSTVADTARTVGRGVTEVPRRLLAGDIDKPIAAEGGVTPLERYNAAKGQGVNLNAAAATQGFIPRTLRFLQEKTLAGGVPYDARTAANVEAWNGAMDSRLADMSPLTGDQAHVAAQNRANQVLSDLSPVGREQGGVQVQGALKAAQGKVYEEAKSLYNDTEKNYGTVPSNDVPSINRVGQKLANQNAAFEQTHPQLKDTRASAIIQNAADLGKDGKSIPLAVLIRARSGLLDAIRGPEITKGTYLDQLKLLAGAYDTAIQNSLPQDAGEAWRQANAKWAQHEGMFDTPSNPYYHALRTPSPASLVEGIGAKDVPSVRLLRNTVGDANMGPVKRGVAESLIPRTQTGEYNLAPLGKNLNNIPDEYRGELFGSDEPRLHELAASGTAEKMAAAPRQQTATTLREIEPHLGDEGMGALRRGTTENLLGSDRFGNHNMQTFGRQSHLLDPEYSRALYGEHEQPLRDLAHTANALDFNPNKSGTAGQVVKYGEGVEGLGAVLHPHLLLPTLAYHGLNYGVARLMNSPAVVDWLMRHGEPVGPMRATPRLPGNPPVPYLLPAPGQQEGAQR